MEKKEKIKIVTNLHKKVEALKNTVKTRNYDGNNLKSAGDFYGIAASNWEEIIRFEDGYNYAIFNVLEKLNQELDKLKL